MSKNDSSNKYGGEDIKNNKLPKVIRVVGVGVAAGAGVAIKFVKSDKGKNMVTNGVKSLGKVIQKL